jgi:hypothetical protein
VQQDQQVQLAQRDQQVQLALQDQQVQLAQRDQLAHKAYLESAYRRERIHVQQVHMLAQ